MPQPVDTAALFQADGMAAVLVLGASAALMGLVEAARRHGRPTSSAAAWRVPLALGAALGVAGGGACLAGLPLAVWLAPLVLSAVWLLFALSRSPLLGRFASLAGRPRLQGGLLLLGGCLLIAAQVRALDRQLDEEIASSDLHLQQREHSDTAPDLREAEGARAMTDRGRPVPLWRVAGPALPGGAVAADQMRRAALERSLIQTAPPGLASNCHGWVFTGGRYWLRGFSVEQILEDNGYRQVSKPEPGDLAVFRDVKQQQQQRMGEVMHTAVVRAVLEDGTVLLESKWGQLGRYVHTAARHAYAAHALTYHRSPRPGGGHLLRGLEEDAPPADVMNAAGSPAS